MIDIKKAYKKLALIHHPDKKGGDDNLFKDISLAYKTLSDISSKKNYDSLTFLKNNCWGTIIYIICFWNEYLKNDNKYDNPPMKKMPIVSSKIDVKLEDIYLHKILKINVRVQRYDQNNKKYMYSNPIFISLLNAETKHVFLDQGDDSPNMRRGDIEIFVNILPHEYITRDFVFNEYDLIIETKINLYQYYTNIEVNIPYFSNETIKLNLDWSENQDYNYLTHQISNKGLPYLDSYGNIIRGSLFIFFKLVLPKKNEIDVSKIDSMLKEYFSFFSL